MDEVAKMTLLDDSSYVQSRISMTEPTTMDHWLSILLKFNAQFSIDFDESVKILDVVLKTKFSNEFVNDWIMRPLLDEENVFKNIKLLHYQDYSNIKLVVNI